MSGQGSKGLTRRVFLGSAAAALLAGAPAVAQRSVQPKPLPLDGRDVWTLNFRYKPPRIETVTLPNGTKKTVWYMYFEVYNLTDKPRDFYPEFELVTKGLNPTTHLDEPQLVIFEALRDIEDPTRAKNLQTTISISKKPIPVSKPDAFPTAVRGLAIWTDIPERAPNVNKFSVFVTGLSNGLTTRETADGNILVSRKTLQLDFIRPTDDKQSGAGDVRLDETVTEPERWVYRAASKRKPLAAPAEAKKDGQ
jgi:hypothetical protein